MTIQEIEELAGHRQVPAWVVKLVSNAVAAEREACAKLVEEWGDPMGASLQIRARGQE
jgi:hypothetical protein